MERRFRHGDVYLKRIDSLPAGVKDMNTSVLAEGELTGHHHRLDGGKTRVFKDFSNQQMYLEVLEPTSLIHEEHRRIPIETGLFAITIEREFDPFSEELERRVRD